MSNSNISSSSSTPPKRPQELSPESIPAKHGWKRAVDTGESKTTSRTSEPKGKEPIEDKPAAKRSMTSNEVSQKKLTETQDLGANKEHQLLPDDVLNLVAKFSGVSDVASISQLSQSLNKISKETDLEKLKQFSENNQLGFKEDLALSILLLAAQIASKPAVGDITGAAEVNINVTPEEALRQLATIEANYQEIQIAYNNFITIVSTIAKDDLTMIGLSWALVVFCSALLTQDLTAELIIAAFYESGASILPAISTTLMMVAIGAGTAVTAHQSFSGLALLKSSATAIMTTLTQNLKT